MAAKVKGKSSLPFVPALRVGTSKTRANPRQRISFFISVQIRANPRKRFDVFILLAISSECSS
jgi:hypothetical protein